MRSNVVVVCYMNHLMLLGSCMGKKGGGETRKKKEGTKKKKETREEKSGDYKYEKGRRPKKNIQRGEGEGEKERSMRDKIKGSNSLLLS